MEELVVQAQSEHVLVSCLASTVCMYMSICTDRDLEY